MSILSLSFISIFLGLFSFFSLACTLSEKNKAYKMGIGVHVCLCLCVYPCQILPCPQLFPNMGGSPGDESEEPMT